MSDFAEGWRKAGDLRGPPRPHTPRRAAYEKRLALPDWQALRAAVLVRAHGICERPGCDRQATEVHHLTYAHFGEERLDELQAVCAPCHPSADLEREAAERWHARVQGWRRHRYRSDGEWTTLHEAADELADYLDRTGAWED